MAKPDLTTYGGSLRDAAYSGMVADISPATIFSMVNELAQTVDYGYAVARGTTADGTCKAPAVDGDVLIGISVRTPIRPADSSGNVVYARYDSVPIMRQGYIYAIAAETVTRGTGVLSLTAQFGKLGGVSAGAAGAGRVVLPGATWETATTAGQVGLIRIVQ
jgi:hypothetical protein